MERVLRLPSVASKRYLTSKVSTVYCISVREGLQVRDALERVLRLPSVASKRYLTSKVSIEYCISVEVCPRQIRG